MSGTVTAVILDLDDTLFPQAAYLAGALDAVAAEGGRMGLDVARFRRALDDAVRGGSDKGGTIDRALGAIGRPDLQVTPLLEAFRSFVPVRLEPYPGVRDALVRLAERVPLGLVSDGYVPGQEAKLAATGLGDLFSAVVFSDSFGREARKPAPVGMEEALRLLGEGPADVVVVGDRPEKDVVAATRAGMRAVRVRTGEYAARPDLPGTWASVDTLAEAVSLIEPLCGRVVR